MKPELRHVVMGLVVAGFAFALVLAIARVKPADLGAPGLKFVSPGKGAFEQKACRSPQKRTRAMQ